MRSKELKIQSIWYLTNLDHLPRLPAISFVTLYVFDIPHTCKSHHIHVSNAYLMRFTCSFAWPPSRNADIFFCNKLESSTTTCDSEPLTTICSIFPWFVPLWLQHHTLHTHIPNGSSIKPEKNPEKIGYIHIDKCIANNSYFSL